MGLEISKRYTSYSFIQSEPNFMTNKAVVITKCNKVINVLAICQKLKMLWHFEILTWKSMGKS